MDEGIEADIIPFGRCVQGFVKLAQREVQLIKEQGLIRQVNKNY